MKKGVHKSLSCILAALVIMMMLPISALATLDSTIEQDPGFTGGPDATAAVSGKTITFTGTIDYYTADAALGRTAGNRVGVKVTAPTGITPGASTTLTIPDGESTRTLTDWDTFKDGDDYFFYYPLVTSGTQTITFTVKWDGTDATADVFTVEIDGATLDPAPLDSTIEQDPGFTGGPDATAAVSGKTITFTGTINYYTADAALGRTAGNRVGVKVTAPTGITPGASTTLTIPDGESTRTLTGWDTFKDGDDYFFYYPLVTSGTQTITFTVKWDGTDATADVFTVEIDGATLDPAPYTLTISPTETAGGAGYTRTVTIGGTEIANLAGKYLVVQFTSGTGANAKVSVVMIQLTADSTTVTVSYQTSGTAVDAWLASAMPNLTEPDMGVTIYADASTN